MFTKTDTNKVKGLAAMLLVFHHMYSSTAGISLMNVRLLLFSDLELSKIALCCRISVYIFVFLSGFGISVSLKNSKPGLTFIGYRLWRLLSPYWFTLLLLNIYYLVWQNRLYYSIHTDSPLMFLGDAFPILDIMDMSENMINGTIWYMNLAMLIVLVAPLMYLLVRRYKILPVIITVLIYSFIPFDIVSPFGMSYLSYIFALEFGVLFCVFDVFGKIRIMIDGLRKIYKTVLFTLLLFLSVLCPYLGWFIVTSDILGVNALLHTLGGISVIILVFLFTPCKFIAVPLEFIGKYSNDIYLTHLFVILPFMGLLTRVVYVLPQYLIAMSGCVFIAYMIFLLKKYTGWLKLIDKISDKIKSN